MNKIYGINILYENKSFIEVLFYKDFNQLQLLNMIHDMYSNLHTSDKYIFQYLNKDFMWITISKDSFLLIINYQHNDTDLIGYIS
jgi:hypothetical protein